MFSVSDTWTVVVGVVGFISLLLGVWGNTDKLLGRTSLRQDRDDWKGRCETAEERVDELERQLMDSKSNAEFYRWKWEDCEGYKRRISGGSEHNDGD